MCYLHTSAYLPATSVQSRLLVYFFLILCFVPLITTPRRRPDLDYRLGQPIIAHGATRKVDIRPPKLSGLLRSLV